jgi:hypothetical protein
MPFIIFCVDNGLFFSGYDPLGDPPGAMEYRTGNAEFTTLSADAKRFDSMTAASEFWRQVHPTTPERPDGWPNRPLTAYRKSGAVLQP